MSKFTTCTKNRLFCLFGEDKQFVFPDFVHEWRINLCNISNLLIYRLKENKGSFGNGTKSEKYDTEYKTEAIKLAKEIGSAKATVELWIPTYWSIRPEIRSVLGAGFNF